MSESRLILFVGIISFMNILDFMMVMPLGPDLAVGLGLPSHLIGVIGGSYTMAAFVAGLAGLFFLDRLPRRKALLVFLGGLAIATMLGGLAWNLTSLLVTRLLAGFCGGPLTALSLAVIADEIPPERRGAAMGKVMGSFAAASVLGVPFGLELSRYLGWRAPFLCFGIIALIILAVSYRHLQLTARPSMSRPRAEIVKTAHAIITNPLTLVMLLAVGCAMMGIFMIIPNISAHLQQNMLFPRSYLGGLYAAGGMVSFFSMRYAGKLIDRNSAALVSALFTSILIVSILLGFVFWQLGVPIIIIFICFMVASTGRNVAAQTLVSKVPSPEHRAAFMSLNSACTHLFTSLGAVLSSQLLSESEAKLLGVEVMGIIACILCVPVPFLIYFIESRLHKSIHTSKIKEV